jgi:hypothetical protein
LQSENLPVDGQSGLNTTIDNGEHLLDGWPVVLPLRFVTLNLFRQCWSICVLGAIVQGVPELGNASLDRFAHSEGLFASFSEDENPSVFSELLP